MTFTSFRFLTVYPSGSVPSLSIRIGQRLQRSLLTQHFSLGRPLAFLLLAFDLPLDTGRIVARTKASLTLLLRLGSPHQDSARHPSPSASSSTTPVFGHRSRLGEPGREVAGQGGYGGADRPAVADHEGGLAPVLVGDEAQLGGHPVDHLGAGLGALDPGLEVAVEPPVRRPAGRDRGLRSCRRGHPPRTRAAPPGPRRRNRRRPRRSPRSGRPAPSSWRRSGRPGLPAGTPRAPGTAPAPAGSGSRRRR